MINAKLDPVESNMVRQWKQVGIRLGFEVVAPATISLPSGVTVSFDMLLPQFGPERGMIVVERSADLGPFEDELVAAGFGYSVLCKYDDDGPSDLSSFIEILQDWVWGGPGEEPAWMRAPSDT